MSGNAANSDKQPNPRLRGLTPFKKGQSGNPSGRPKKVVAVSKLAEAASVEAMKKLIALSKDSDPKVAIAACNAILDRGIGRPKQQVEMDASVKHDHGSKPVSETAAWIAGVLGDGQDRASEEPLPN